LVSPAEDEICTGSPNFEARVNVLQVVLDTASHQKNWYFEAFGCCDQCAQYPMEVLWNTTF
jgi:hypothetical protein